MEGIFANINTPPSNKSNTRKHIPSLLLLKEIINDN